MKYFDRLDGLRAVAAGLVVASHFLPREYLFGVEWGIYGVTLFFVISGFLITGILNRHHKESKGKVLRAFYARRFLRIFPLFYLALVYVYFVNPVDLGSDIWWHAAYLSNWFFWLEGSWVPGHPVHFWSLAVEEQFYLFWPLIFLLGVRRFPRIAGGLFVAGLGFRFGMISLGWTAHAWTKLTFACLEALGAGAFLATVTKTPRLKLNTVWYIMLVVIFLLVHCFMLPSEWGYEIRYQSVVLLSAATVWAVCIWSNTWFDRLLLHPAIRYLGSVSYGIYVWHLLVDEPWSLLQPYWSGFCSIAVLPGWVEFGLGNLLGKLLLTLVFSVGSWNLLEKPLLRLKGRFQYS